MELIRRLFGGRSRAQGSDQAQSQDLATPQVLETEWEALPSYVPAEGEEALRVSIIASALAASHYPDSQFVVKQVLKHNPEVTEVSVIAAAIAAGQAPDSQWTVGGLYRKRT